MPRLQQRPVRLLFWTALITLSIQPVMVMPTYRSAVPPALAEPQQTTPVRIILLGPPGAGKTTQAQRLAELYKVPAISTGQLLRQAAAADTPEGRDLQATLTKGDLVPDDKVITLLKARMKQPDTAAGWVLHGFPRTLLQALALDNMLVDAGQAVQLVVALDVPTKTLVERLSHRLICKSCGRSYNTETNPPQQAGVCDADGGQLVQRPDDQPDVATGRVEDQTRRNEEMKAYYDSRDIFLSVDGTGDIASVQNQISRELKKRSR